MPSSTRGRTSNARTGRPSRAAMSAGAMPGFTAKLRSRTTYVRLTITVCWKNTGWNGTTAERMRCAVKLLSRTKIQARGLSTIST